MGDKRNPYDNPALLGLTKAVDCQMQQSLLAETETVMTELLAEIDQMEEVMSSCFQPGMAEGGQSAMMDAHKPLFDGWKRKQAELHNCRAKLQQLQQEGQSCETESRVDSVCNLLAYWVFDEINKARRLGQTQVTIPLEKRPERVGRLMVEVIKKAPVKLNLSGHLVDNQLIISF